jgi:hypothetical protein
MRPASRADEGPAWKVRPLPEGAPARLVMPCRCRRCPACLPRWCRRVKAVLLSGLRAPGIDGESAFITVTAPGRAGGLVDEETIEAWNEGAARRWNHLRTIFRQHYPAAEFFRVAELQGRGAIHYHVLVRGVPLLTREMLSAWAVRAGFGYVCDVRALRHAGGAAAYLTKYLTKDVEEWPPGRRVWSCSARWRVVWKRDSRLRGTFVVRVLGRDEVYISVSPWQYDAAASRRLSRLRSQLHTSTPAPVRAPNVGLSTSSS